MLWLILVSGYDVCLPVQKIRSQAFFKLAPVKWFDNGLYKSMLRFIEGHFGAKFDVIGLIDKDIKNFSRRSNDCSLFFASCLPEVPFWLLMVDDSGFYLLVSYPH